METFKKVLKKFFWFFNGLTEENCAYRIIALVGFIIRVVILSVFLPDPINLLIEFLLAKIPLPRLVYEILYRVIVFIADLLGLSRIRYHLSFAAVGVFYRSRSDRPVGSLAYTLYYTLYTLIPVLLLNYFVWWAVLVSGIAYQLLFWGVYFSCKAIIPHNGGYSRHRDSTLSDNYVTKAIIHELIFTAVFVTLFVLSLLL